MMPRLVMHTNDLVNKVSASNVKDIIPELFQHNPIPGRSLFCRFVHEIPIGVRQVSQMRLHLRCLLPIRNFL